jgi:hypothetical protein
MVEYIVARNKDEYENLCNKREESVKSRGLAFVQLCNKHIEDSNVQKTYSILLDKLASKQEKEEASKQQSDFWKTYDAWKSQKLKEHNESFKLEPIPWFDNITI